MFKEISYFTVFSLAPNILVRLQFASVDPDQTIVTSGKLVTFETALQLRLVAGVIKDSFVTSDVSNKNIYAAGWTYLRLPVIELLRLEKL